MSAATESISRTRRDIRGALFYVLLLASLALAMVTLVVLVGDVVIDGGSWLTTDPPL